MTKTSDAGNSFEVNYSSSSTNGQKYVVCQRALLKAFDGPRKLGQGICETCKVNPARNRFCSGYVPIVTTKYNFSELSVKVDGEEVARVEDLDFIMCPTDKNLIKNHQIAFKELKIGGKPIFVNDDKESREIRESYHKLKIDR